MVVGVTVTVASELVWTVVAVESEVDGKVDDVDIVKFFFSTREIFTYCMRLA